MLQLGTAMRQPEGGPPFPWVVERLRELGWEPGRTLRLDYVQTGEQIDVESAMRLVAGRGAAILLAAGNERQLRAALAASGGRLPVVMVAIDFDPLALGLVRSLTRPEGNVTGLFLRQPELARKRFELLADSFPAARRIGAFWDSNSAEQWEATEAAARARGLTLLGHRFPEASHDYPGAIRALGLAPGEPVAVMNSPAFFAGRQPLVAALLAGRLPAIFAWREWVDLGGLISYGPGFRAIMRRSAEYIDRLARGAKPADLPIEQPDRFELVVNLRSATAIGVDLPASMLSRADETLD